MGVTAGGAVVVRVLHGLWILDATASTKAVRTDVLLGLRLSGCAAYCENLRGTRGGSPCTAVTATCRRVAAGFDT
jgi:hypothetical protein